MRIMKTISKLDLVIFVFLISGLSSAYAQNAQTSTTNQSGYRLGGFVGFTDRRDSDFTFGAEFEFPARDRWSYGALVEHTPNVFRNGDATVLLATANFRPNPSGRLRLTGGAGVEFKDYADDDLRFRIGTGYDLVIEGNLTVTPRIAFDFGEGDENLVFGATFSQRF